MDHLIFFDDECPFCQLCVRSVLRKDPKGKFGYAPLRGKTAKEMGKGDLFKKDTLILVENYKQEKRVWARSQAVFRIYWLLGGKWKILGGLYFLPSFLSSWIYLFIASYRDKLYRKKELGALSEEEKKRFFP